MRRAFLCPLLWVAVALSALSLCTSVAQAGVILNVDFCGSGWNNVDTISSQAGFEGWNGYFNGVGYELATPGVRYDPSTANLDVRVMSDKSPFTMGSNTKSSPPAGFTLESVSERVFFGSSYQFTIDGDLILPNTDYKLTLYANTEDYGGTDSVFSDDNGAFSGSVTFVGAPATDADVQVTGTFHADATGEISITVSKGAGTNYATVAGVTIADVPEPATMGLLSLGFAGLAALRRRKK